MSRALASVLPLVRPDWATFAGIAPGAGSSRDLGVLRAGPSGDEGARDDGAATRVNA